MNNTSPLLVPVAVEALLVNHIVQSKVAFHRWQINYRNLLEFKSPVPLAFQDLSAPPDSGVHLHWALPRALTRGKQVQATAEARVSDGCLTGVSVTGGGYGYADAQPPLVTIEGGGGGGATAEAVVNGGVVTAIRVTGPGSGYTSAPRVTIAPSPSMDFPYVPNRWLVVRYSPAPSASQPRPTKAWLLQSDTIDPKAAAGESNSFVNPFPAKAGAIEPTRLGTKATVLQSWAGEAGAPQRLFLRALGPGEATFAAYQPGVVNVFSFYDPINDASATFANPDTRQRAEQLPENTYLTYLIAGWYSDPKHDPLYGHIGNWNAVGDPVRKLWKSATDAGAEWDSLLGSLGWSVSDLAAVVSDAEASPGDEDAVASGGVSAGDERPTQSLFHGLIYGVNWQTTSVPERVNSTPEQMQVAVGNTSIDALAAIVSLQAKTPAHGAREAELLEAFQYNFLRTLDQTDGRAQLDLQIRQAAFGSVPGGTFWQIVAAQTAETETGQLDSGVVPPSPPLTEAQAEKFAALNRAQRELDETARSLASSQWELYATWWKKNRLAKMTAAELTTLRRYFSNVEDIKKLINKNAAPGPDTLFQQVTNAQATVRKLAQGLPDATNPQSIQAYATNVLGLDPAKLQLKPTTMPRFYQPTDPVVLVAGLQTSEKQGALDEGPLPCRLMSQTVTGVNIQSGGQTVAVTAATAGMRAVIPAPTNPNLPAAVATGLAALEVEAFFVDPADAPTIVAVGLGSSDQKTVDDLRAAMQAGTAQIKEVSSPPAPDYMFSRWTQQPWSPLYMEWEVVFYPTVQPGEKGSKINWPFAPVALTPPTGPTPQPVWAFNGTDFEWYGTLPQKSQNYVGRTFLTPQSTYVMIARLRKYLKEHPNPDLKAVEELIERVGEWNFLSQRLSGLMDQFIMRDLTQSQPPDATVSAQVGEQYNGVPDPSKGTQDTSFGSKGTPFFFPVRGGFLKFVELLVVDSFGQVIDLMKAGGNTGTGVPFAPVRGRGLAPMAATRLPQPSELVQLAPRLVQTSRLDFRFVSATDDARETGLWPDANPVCGWVLPNHLDGGLSVYDAGGNALGELLLLAESGGGRAVHRLPAPGPSRPLADAGANKHLTNFINALTGAKDGGTGFLDLLTAVDETLWTIDPSGGRADQNLSVLIGRPLALVRARLRLELDGRPVYSHSWGETLRGLAGGVEQIDLPVRLGSLDLYDDGLMGYFEGDNYATFNAVRRPEGWKPAVGAYLKPIGYEGNYLKLRFDYPNYTTKLVTLLLDPRGEVHALTGLLPSKIVSLPAAYYEDALARMAVTFRTGPVLTDAAAVRIPPPSERNGQWSWVQRTDAAKADSDPTAWESPGIVKADQQARLPDAPTRLVEGWLKLTPNDIEK
jgi:hypothetical protein